MALGKCRDCMRPLSTDAFECAYCHADNYPAKVEESDSSFWVLMIFLIIILGSVAGSTHRGGFGGACISVYYYQNGDVVSCDPGYRVDLINHVCTPC